MITTSRSACGSAWGWLLAGAAVSALAGPAAAQEPRHGGTAIIHMPSEQRILNPALRASTGVYNITGKIMEPLIDKSYDGPVGVLATDWSSTEDGLHITVKLREGVNWHDGEPFTCDDVAFSAMELWKPLLNYSSTLQQYLESVDCTDPHTAVFNYSQPMPLDLFVAAMPDLGHPVPKHLYEGTDIMRNEHNTAPVGTGPFKFVEYKRGQYVIAGHNDDYWRGKEYPYLDRIVWRFIPDKSAAAAAIEAGEIHESGFNGVSMADIERFSKMDGFDVGTQGYENNVAHSTVEFNHRNPILADLKVRQAIYHGLDIDYAIKTIMRGYAKPGRGPIPSAGGANYTDDVTTYAYDPELAKKMLDEAGYPEGPDGIRFKLRHRPAPWGEYTQLWAEYFAQAMKEIGIEVEILTNDAPGFLNGVYRDHDFDTANGWHQFRSDPAVSTMVWLRSGSPAGTPWSNQFGWQSDEMDRMIDEAQAELDPDQRAADYHAIQKLAMEEIPVIFAIEHPFISVTSQKLHNHHNTPRWNSSSWYDLWLEK
ncbi:ABC transporter substrate-binding protein [Rhodovulum visakhapatnamense]|uniref:ABC transporter substrate-binding protein n=1 Tax=Rhodovulum visakhapatnamense TaxID=364297 RepID=A0ABS1RLB2_9RHOB|nr:ABC transporter substrate-binding protein [Rhodovulum visakhapatnamense]MBL3580294.1 ABC transporter substrate-binding protein [Rhodovulum visakhapatnamense]